ncbi:flagellar hook-length control protein FliK [Pseudorhodoplanes sp.]|uniref:flagellar hook-length control protein FliK n=1 Tax=Pseudorhodoplanes sp. TaxID=1934341 RepID=UPI0039199EF7
MLALAGTEVFAPAHIDAGDAPAAATPDAAPADQAAVSDLPEALAPVIAATSAAVPQPAPAEPVSAPLDQAAEQIEGAPDAIDPEMARTASPAPATPTMDADADPAAMQTQSASFAPQPQIAKAAQQSTGAPAADSAEPSDEADGQPLPAATPQSADADRDGTPANSNDSDKAAKPAAKPAEAPTARHSDATDKTSPAQLGATADDSGNFGKAQADPSAQLAQLATPAPAHSAAPQSPAVQAPVSAAQPIPINAIAVEIAAQARAGNSRFEIRLDPPELGRIDVRLDIDRDGNVKSRLVIERADTYDLLRRDQSTLERALQQAGLKTSDHALEFSLRDQGFAERRENGERPREANLIQDPDLPPSDAVQGYTRLAALRGGLDIRV